MFFAKRLTQFAELKHIFARSSACLKGKTDCALIHRFFQFFHTIKRFFAAFCGTDGFFAVEHAVAGDDCLLTLDFLLLNFIGAHAGFKALLPLCNITGIVSVILFGRTHQDFNDARADMIEKIAVVGNDQHAAFIGRKIVFKPLKRLHIQMVGRLVQ